MGVMRGDVSSIRGLKELIKHLPDDIVMGEIGCFEGDSTRLFLESGKVKSLYCIDAWTSGYDDTDGASRLDLSVVEKTFNANIMDNFDNVTKCKGWSYDMVKQFDDGFFDVLYIDGNHQYDALVNDINLYLPKIKSTGIISGHDYYNDSNRRPKDAVDSVFGNPDMRFVDTSWLVFLK